MKIKVFCKFPYYHEGELCGMHPEYKAEFQPKQACLHCWFVFFGLGGGVPRMKVCK